MKNIEEIQVTPKVLLNQGIDDEYLFRELAMKMVSKISFSDLSKLMIFTKTDPNSKESDAKIRNSKTTLYEKGRILMLKQNEVILYKAEVDTSVRSEINNLTKGYINYIVDIGKETINLRKVVRVGKIGGDDNWLRYSIYFVGGDSIEIYQERRFSDNTDLVQMKREKFIEMWKLATI